MAGLPDALTANLAPGPTGNPITTQLRPFEEDPLRFLLEMQRGYGDVVRLRLWPQVFHLISSPGGIRHVLSTHAGNYHGPPAAQRGRLRDRQRLLSGGMHSLSDDLFVLTRRMEKLGREVFHREQVESFAETMTAGSAALLDGWRERARDSAAFDVEAELLRLTQTILGDTLFHADLGEVGLALGGLLDRSAPQLRVSLFQRLERSSEEEERAWHAAMAAVDRFVTRLIAERRERGPSARDLLSILIFDEDEVTGEPLPPQKLWEAVTVFLIAGHTAIASALTWTCCLLAQHREAMRQAQREVDAVLAGRVPTLADLPRLRFTHMVVQEALRLYPPVWMFAPRMAAADDTIEGFRIPARSMVLISPYVLHRHAAYWQQPEAFLPERFAAPAPPVYMPFGSGPWGCVGSQFGLLEARLVLPMLLQRYDWELAPGQAIALDPQLALRPRGGLRIIAHARSEPPA
ncbi:MAG TPA: cytochrome P450 [Dehalococcoidia bacterium]|nr:cytochrome P450 [Dehalococcoidia bacterium]